jgi:hypothetical protein
MRCGWQVKTEAESEKEKKRKRVGKKGLDRPGPERLQFSRIFAGPRAPVDVSYSCSCPPLPPLIKRHPQSCYWGLPVEGAPLLSLIRSTRTEGVLCLLRVARALSFSGPPLQISPLLFSSLPGYPLFTVFLLSPFSRHSSFPRLHFAIPSLVRSFLSLARRLSN